MKHYLVEVTFSAPLEQIQPIVEAHRAFLQTGFDKGWLLMSGPMEPRTGGFIIGRAPSLEELQDFFSNDPYLLGSLADYRFVEFVPVKHQPFIAEWVAF